MRSFPIVALLCLLAGACDQPAVSTKQPGGQPADAREQAALERDVTNIQAGVVRDTNAQRLDELERRIARIETNPDKLDLELLASRVQALEVKAGMDSLAATTPGVPGATPAPRATPSPPQSPARASSGPKPKVAPRATPTKPAPRPQSSPSNGATEALNL
ncbi:hypothetical protein [Sphingomonas sp.]|uniref:hypothetical protein n=1 Tax=Sphingomonas sp. TaxID=28214 RepID=UPI0035C8433B